MKKYPILPVTTLILLSSATVSADAFPHKTAIYQRTMTGPMMEITSEVYTRFSPDINKFMEAEWRVQKTPAGVERALVLTENGYNYTLNLDTRQCTKTNIAEISNQLFKGGDPKAFAEQMKQQLGLKEAGPCEGAGLKGAKLTSQMMSMCMYQDILPLWQEIMGSVTKITTIRFDQKLPSDKITLPSGINCTEGPSPQEMMGRMKGYPQSAGPGDQTDATMPQEMPDMNEAMKQAEEAMQKFQEMMKQQTQE